MAHCTPLCRGVHGSRNATREAGKKPRKIRQLGRQDQPPEANRLHVQDVVPLPYLEDPCGYFARIRHRPGAVLLDSARPFSREGRFDLLSSDPLARVESRAGVTREWHGGR